MPKIKIWNDAQHDWEEDYQGEKVFIPSGSSVTMERRDAIMFLGQWAEIQKDGLGNIIRSKMLRPEGISSNPSSFADSGFTSNINGEKFNSQKELDAHYEENKHLRVKDEDEEKTTTPKMVYVCDTCNDEFESKVTLLKHKESHNDTSTSKSARKKPGRRTNR